MDLKKEIEWEKVTGSDEVKPCIVCDEVTSQCFWGPFKKGQREFIRPYYFCTDDCVRQFKMMLG